LQALADLAGMSRSTFALRFKETVGKSPMEYLTRWRMLLAGDRLTNSRDSISTIALSLGYESESAFSTAFKRIMGGSPRQYGRAGTHARRSDVASGGGRPDTFEPRAEERAVRVGDQRVSAASE
jgi:AraC-like DNA-binding protein